METGVDDAFGSLIEVIRDGVNSNTGLAIRAASALI